MTTPSKRMRAVGASLLLCLTYAMTTGCGGAASGAQKSIDSASSQRATSTSRLLAVSPSSINFGTVTVGASASQSATLSASGQNVKVSSASINSNEFTISGINFPVSISAGQSVPFTVTFAPQLSGTASGVITFASNASNSPTQTLSGSGAAPAQHSASLSWTASTSAVVGYNIYRSGQSGGPYTKLNSALNATTNFPDMTVQAGQTYYYVTTAVNGSGAESVYSNQIQLVIPSP